ncbi:hypothetical protein HNQ07_000431 [Deinococcus metalli]|uniref:Uncharacterized protein n=1 Tax=Deinococcus metalli TaxID=1141878 RepID=A0A7W8KB46_9DEIO|nr:hypothetical protein [Deinococcus metalli]MBB5374987.1 hypothetical protein [Deinococcus metalli]GHF32271.1 hypothetical protein GCM10017781_06120 [Deinococcus metalli]
MTVPNLLALLTSCGAHVTARGDTLALSGKRPPAPLLDALRARKADVLAYLLNPAQGEAVPVPPSPDPAPRPAGPAPEVVSPRYNLPDRPDWAQIAAQEGRCGSCALAVDAPEWGPLMVTCSCAPDAWWPLPAPLALHVGARCGAYLTPGDDVGRGYRSHAAAQTWGTGARAAPRSVQGGRA